MFDQFFDCSLLRQALKRIAKASVCIGHRKVVLNERGFSMIEAVAALGLSGAVIASCMYLAGESSTQISKRVDGAKGYLALQNISEQLLVSNGSNGYLDEGDHGPIYFDTSGKIVTGTGPIQIKWTVTMNDPSPNIIKVKTVANWGGLMGGGPSTQTANLVIYRSSPLQGSSTVVETVALPSPTPTPTPPTTYAWYNGWNACLSGHQTNYVQCRTNLNVVVGDGLCTGASPAPAIIGCGAITYSWNTGAWEPFCTNGTHARIIVCKSSGGVLQSDPGPCNPLTKPATTESCDDCYPFCK
jgi:hypothetical protein